MSQPPAQEAQVQTAGSVRDPGVPQLISTAAIGAEPGTWRAQIAASTLPAETKALILNGVQDPETTSHGPNESLHLGVFDRAIRANVYLYDELGALPR